MKWLFKNTKTFTQLIYKKRKNLNKNFTTKKLKTDNFKLYVIFDPQLEK